MKRILQLLTAIIFFAGFQTVAWAQCGDLAGKDIGITQPKFCAPADIYIDVLYKFPVNKHIDATKAKIRVYWDLTNKSIFTDYPVSEAIDGLNMQRLSAPTSHYYTVGAVCRYEAAAYLIINGQECSGSAQPTNFALWNTDDNNPGPVAMDPKVAEFCPQTEIKNFKFYDNTNFNCNIGVEKDVPNRRYRWVQFIYNTKPDNGKLIKNLTIGGVPFTDGAGNALISHFEAPVERIEEPADGPISFTLPINAPAGSNVGDFLEVTMRNWNTCNPYDNTPDDGNAPLGSVDGSGNAVAWDNAPKTATSQLLIVAGPVPSIIAPLDVCPKETITLKGGSSIGNVDYVWKIYDDDLGVKQIGSDIKSKDYTFTNGFSTAGKKLVILQVKRKNLYDGSCWGEVKHYIEVSDAPAVDAYINGNAVNELNLCYDPAAASGQSVTYKYDISSANKYTYQLSLFKRNSTSASADSTDGSGNIVGSGLVQVTTINTPSSVDHTSVYKKPGKYRVQIYVKDQTTGCETKKELVTYVYDKPVAAFSSVIICQGEATSFTNLSSLKHKINGDDISSYSWNFGDPDIIGGGTSTDKNPNHTYSSTGPFDVSLTVKTSKGGCENIITNSVTVFPVPVATLSSNYVAPICPGEAIEFTIDSYAANEIKVGAGKVFYFLQVFDGTNINIEPFIPGTDKRSLTFYNTTNNELTHEVKLKAKSHDGCEILSNPILIKVMPGDKARFSDPAYSIFNANCTDIDFQFEVDPATLAIGGEEHKWVIYEDGVKKSEQNITNNTDPKFKIMPYKAINTGFVGMLVEVHLYVKKSGKCVQPAIEKYLVQPKPAKEDFVPAIRQDCYYTYVDIKLNQTVGIKDYNWTISPAPDNLADIILDDEFTLKFERPVAAINGGAPYTVSMTFEKENVFGCTQTVLSTSSIDIFPKDIENVDLQLVSSITNGCSPLTIDFKNETQVAAGSTFTYELYLNNGSGERKVDISDPASGFKDGVGETDGLEGAFSFTFTSPGSYSARLKAIGTDCELYSPSTVFFVVHDSPKAEFDLSKKEGCALLTSTIINNIQGSATNHWIVTDIASGTEILNTTDPITSIDFPNTGTTMMEYKVELIAESSNGCTAKSEKKVKVYPAPTAGFTVKELEVCAPFEVEVTNTALSSNPVGTTYTWNWGDGFSTASADPVLQHSYSNPSFSTAQPKYITLTAVTPDGCTITSAPIEVSLRPQVKAAFTPSATMACSPLQLYLQNNSLGASTHSWEIKEQGSTAPALYTSSASLPNDVPELINDGSSNKIYEVSLTVANAEGCVNTHTEQITITPGAKADFSMDYTAAICTESEVLFTNLYIATGIKYVWNWGDGEENDTTTTEASIIHTFINTSTTKAKQYEITLTALNPASNCAEEMKKTVRVNPTVEAMVVPDKVKGCAPLEVNFTNQSRNVATHKWYVGLLGSPDQDQSQGVGDASFILENNTGGILQYEVTYVGTSATGCSDTARTLVNVYPTPEPAFITDSVRVRLPNTTFNITNETAFPDAWIHHWDFGDGTTSAEAHPGSHTYATYGKYKIVLKVSNGICSESFSKEVIVNEILPIVDFKSIPVSGCWPLVVQFENNSKYTDPNTYRWDFGDGEGYATSENPTYTYHKPGQYTVTLSGSNPSGEVVSQSYAIVNVYARPRIDFELRETVVYVPGDPLYVANYTKGASTYLWDFGDGTTYTDFEPVHYYQKPGVYTISLIATNEWGCADTLMMKEVVTAEAGGKIKIPNAFTPSLSGSVSGDVSAGNNDVFFPVLEGGVTTYNMRIYNRWGELLFESNQRDMGWDGYYKGKLCKADVYVFKLRVEYSDGKKMEKLGDVTLIR